MELYTFPACVLLRKTTGSACLTKSSARACRNSRELSPLTSESYKRLSLRAPNASHGCGLYLQPVQYGCGLYLEPV
jgi:hypothetical protein